VRPPGRTTANELVCKVFDASPGWRLGRVPSPRPGQADAGAVSGRGLAVVHEYWTYADLVEVTERAVWMHEEIEHAIVPARGH